MSPLKSDMNAFSRLSENSLTSKDLTRLEQDLMALSPAAFAMMASAGRWQMAPHLAYLDRMLLAALEDAAAERLEGLVVSMPPQHGKSELCSKYLPAWYLCNYPNRRVIVTGYGNDFAAQWGGKSRDLVRKWGPAFQVHVSKRSSSADRWDLEKYGGGMVAAGVGGPLTGKGANLLIIDDPIKNDGEARSPLKRQNLWDWWQSTASTRVRRRGLTLIIQTRWHRDDLAGRILHEAKTNRQRWREVRLAALAEDGDPLGRAPGDPLWPDKFPLAHLSRVRDGKTPYYWRALYQQDPIAEGSTEWPDHYFSDKIWFDEWPTDVRIRAMALDPSKGRSARYGDYSAFVMLAVARDGTMYVDADLAVRNIAVMVETAIELARVFRPNGFAVETNQFQELLVGEMARVSKERNVNFMIHPFDNGVPKVVRIRRLTPTLAREKFRFKADSPGARLLVRQLRDFPHGDHDDGPDALEMALRLAIGLSTPPQPWGTTERAIAV